MKLTKHTRWCMRQTTREESKYCISIPIKVGRELILSSCFILFFILFPKSGEEGISTRRKRYSPQRMYETLKKHKIKIAGQEEAFVVNLFLFLFLGEWDKYNKLCCQLTKNRRHNIPENK